MKVRLKSELIWFLKDGKIEFYYGNSYLKREIDCEDTQKLFDFLSFLKEPRAESEIVAYEGLSEKEKNDVLDYFYEKNYLQKVSDRALSRTELFINTFPDAHFESYREKVSQTRIILIGAGTAGSYLLEVLSKLTFSHFIIIDGDRVEKKNLEAQYYTIRDVGCPKVDVLAKKYCDFVTVTSFYQYIHQVTELKQIIPDLSGNDIIINAADDHQLMLSLAKAKAYDGFSPKIIETGYGVLAQNVYLIDDTTVAKRFEHHIEKMLEWKMKSIVENSGSVLNGFASALMVGQLILDSILAGSFEKSEYNFYSKEAYVSRFKTENIPD